jgi:SAM-dependent methyltransferase
MDSPMQDESGAEPQYFACRQVVPADYRDYRLPEVLRAALPLDRSASILDIGCGFGHFLKALQESGYESLAGVDISPEAVAYCRAEGLPVERIGDLEEYCRQAARRYDFIMMSHVLEHIEKARIIPTLREIRARLLSENGCVCVMVPNAQSATGCYWAYEDFTHTTLFTAGSLLHVLTAAGFRQITFLDPDGLSETPFPTRLIKRLLLRLYVANRHFWNRVTGSSYHRPSPELFTFELKVLARR